MTPPTEFLLSWKLEHGLFDRHPFRYFTDEEADWYMDVEKAWRAANPPMSDWQARKLFGLAPPEGAVRGGLDRDRILEKCDMMTLLNAYVPGPYRSIGNNRLQVHCPFHGPDKRASMTVDLERKRWRCWTEQEGGTAIDLVMKAEGLAFLPALRKLSQMFT